MESFARVNPWAELSIEKSTYLMIHFNQKSICWFLKEHFQATPQCWHNEILLQLGQCEKINFFNTKTFL